MTTKPGVRVAEPAMLNEGGGPWGGRGGSGGGSGDGGGGNGPRNPWEQPPEGGKPRGGKGASAIDELMRQARNVRGQVPGGIDPRWWGYGALALLAVWVIWTSFHQIEPAERGVVTRLGRYSHTLEPGVSFTLPAPIDRVQVVDVQNIRTFDIPDGSGEQLVLTGDQNLMNLKFSIGWRIRDPEQWFFQSANPEETIKNVASSAMRAAIANTPLNAAIGSGRSGIEAEVKLQVQTILDRYGLGLQIERVTISKTDPPEKVVDAFNEVTAAGSNAQTSINNARTYAQQIVAKAEGDAEAFNRVYAQYKLSPEVTRRRMYYETMERVLAKTDKTIVEAPGVTPYLPLRELKRPPEAQTGPAQ